MLLCSQTHCCVPRCVFSFPLAPSPYPALGAVPSPFDCYLCNRGLKTLHLRMERHFKNAMAAAKFLEADPRVERVVFPGDCTVGGVLGGRRGS